MVRLRPRLVLFLCVFALISQARADLSADLPDDWFTRPPTPERLKVVQTAAEAGWTPLAGRIYQGSLRAYELKQEDSATAWYYVARWCDLLGKSQKASSEQWLRTMAQAKALHSSIDQVKIQALPDKPLARLLTPETITWLLGDREFTESFFGLLSDHDLPAGVFIVLQMLRNDDVARVMNYRQLALAIALVYDTPPPPQWPHWQVTPEVLPRRLPLPAEAFRFLTGADQSGRTLQKLSTLGATELKFLVDLSAGFPELAWAQQSVKFPLVDLAKSYEAVRYRQDRIEAKDYVWKGEKYDLPTIYKEGGICVDQAYFASQAGKARGVPTLLFSGAGRDGRHAWFGYLGAGRKWILDAGRYADQQFVTGVAIDPQTWTELSDHELSFLSEGFHRLSSYRLSLQHQVFAALYLTLGNKTAAAAAARKAVNAERRNAGAWTLLLQANAEAPVSTREALLREAALAFQRYPDLNGAFVQALAASMRERGAVAAAEFEERSLVRRGQTKGRTDVGVEQAVKVMDAAPKTEAVRVYRQVLQQYGAGGGMDFYDKVTRPLLEQLISDNQRGEAMKVIAYTRAGLKPAFRSQLDVELTEMADKMK